MVTCSGTTAACLPVALCQGPSCALWKLGPSLVSTHSMPVAPSFPSWDNQKHFCKCPQGANSPAAENLWSAHIFFVSFASQPGAVGAGITDTEAEEFGGLTTERPVAGPGSEASAPTGGPLTLKQKPVIQEASGPLGRPGHPLTFSFFGLSLKTSACRPLGESSQCCRIFWPAYPSCHRPPQTNPDHSFHFSMFTRQRK